MLIRQKRNRFSVSPAILLRFSACVLLGAGFVSSAAAQEAKEWVAPSSGSDTQGADSGTGMGIMAQPDIDSQGPEMSLPPPPNLPGVEFTAEEDNALPPARTLADIEKETRRRAFDNALQGILPLRPEEIRELLEHFDRTREAVEVPVYPAPRPEVAVETIPLDPGTMPPAIKVAQGNVTTLSFLDVTGAPWPIQDISWAGNFEVVESGSQEGAHMVRISPQSEFAAGNMSVRLLTLKTPVILTLETSRDIVHYRFDAIIADYGPMAEAPLIDRGLTIKAGSQELSAVLRGVPPGAATKLSVSGVDGRTTAYRLNGQTFVRTPLTLLSPTWSSSVSSADGMRVYAIQDAPVLLMSDRGKMVRAHLSDREDITDE